MTRTVVRIAAALVAAAAVVALTAGTASAHHVFLEFEATGDLVPGGGGDPDASAAGVIDFNSEESPEVCIEAVGDGLDGITDVVIVAKADESLLLDFGDSLDTCVVATDEQREALHDAADDYLLVIATEQFPEGAVAGEIVEQEPTTTTSSTVPEETTSTTAAAVAAATTPRFTG